MAERPFSLLIGTEGTVSGLEVHGRAEGLIQNSDFPDREFGTRVPVSVSGDRTPLDYVCLYKQVLVRPRNIDLDILNSRLGEIVFRRLPDFTRGIDWSSREEWISLIGDSDHEYDIKYLDKLQIFAFNEAQIWSIRSVEQFDYLYRDQFDQLVPGDGWRDPFSPEKTHKEAIRILRNLADDIVYLMIYNFVSGRETVIDNLIVEDSDLEIGPKRLLLKSLLCPRFENYFYQFQEVFCGRYEAAFDGHLLEAELAYDAIPAAASAETPTPSDVVRVLRVNLSDVVDYFPLPRTLREAIEFRNDPKVVAFRYALERWIRRINRGQEPSEVVRRELMLANRDLRRLASWRHLRERPIVFGIRTLASAIPGLGFATAGLDALSYFGERYFEKRHAWVVTPDLRKFGRGHTHERNLSPS